MVDRFNAFLFVFSQVIDDIPHRSFTPFIIKVDGLTDIRSILFLITTMMEITFSFRYLSP